MRPDFTPQLTPRWESVSNSPLFKFLSDDGQSFFAALVVSTPISRNAVLGEQDLPVMSVQVMSLHLPDFRPFSGAPKGCGGEGGQVTGMSTPQDPQLPPFDPDPERNPPGPPPVPIRDPEEPGHLKFIGWGHSETVQLLCGHGRHRPDPGPFP